MFLAHLSAEAVEGWLADRRGRAKKDGGFSVQTSNHFVAAVKAFGNWCVRTKRVPANPFAHLGKLKPELDVRHERRDLVGSGPNAGTGCNA